MKDASRGRIRVVETLEMYTIVRWRVRDAQEKRKVKDAMLGKIQRRDGEKGETKEGDPKREADKGGPQGWMDGWLDR